MGAAVPVAVIAAGIAAKFLHSLFGGIAQKKQLQAQKDAETQRFKNEVANWNANEKNRAGRLGAANTFLTGAQGSFAPGAPQYALDPETLSRLQAPRPYPGAMGADPTKGSIYGLLSGLAGGVASGINDAYIGGLLRGKSAPDPNAPNPSVSNPANLTRYQSNRVCVFMPTYPGCPGAKSPGSGSGMGSDF